VQIFPSTHYVNFAQGILYRGAGIEIVWRSFAAITVIGLIFFAVALLRFRRTVAITSFAWQPRIDTNEHE
jgi:ABC-2 type transport system permease protein